MFCLFFAFFAYLDLYFVNILLFFGFEISKMLFFGKFMQFLGIFWPPGSYLHPPPLSIFPKIPLPPCLFGTPRLFGSRVYHVFHRLESDNLRVTLAIVIIWFHTRHSNHQTTIVTLLTQQLLYWRHGRYYSSTRWFRRNPGGDSNLHRSVVQHPSS